MKRVNMYLTERIVSEMQKEADKYGISPSEMIRRVLDQHVDNKEKRDASEVPDNA